MSNDSISPELYYTPVVNSHSTTVFRKISPQGASTAIGLSATAAVGPSTFIISPSVFNFRRSRLNFELELQDPGASVKVNWVNANFATIISRIAVTDQSTGALWMDLSNIEKYVSMINPALTELEDFLSKGVQGTAVMTLPTTSAATVPYAYSDIGKSNSLVNVTAGNVALAGTTGFNSYLGRRQVYAGVDTEKSYASISLPLSAFHFTVLELNKNIYCPSNLSIDVYFNATDNFGWTSTSITDPTAGTAASLTSGSYINNLSLQLANEGNLQIVTTIIDKVMREGLTLTIPYATTVRQAISASTAHSYSLQLTRAYGNTILGLATAPFSENSTAINARNIHFRGALTVYNTYLNGQAILYPNGIDASKSEDYFIANREFMKGSAIQNLGEYVYAEWVHFDSFVGYIPLHKFDVSHVDGMAVGTQMATWQIQATLSSSYAVTWVTAILGQKTLQLSNQGSMIL
jgi:hypothetical protein